MGECLEIGVESWLLEPVPLAERGHRAGEGRRWRDKAGGGGEEEVNTSVVYKVCRGEGGMKLRPWPWRKVIPELRPHLAPVKKDTACPSLGC